MQIGRQLNDTKIEHDCFWSVRPGDSLYELRVGTNIKSALYWNPENFKCLEKKVMNVEDVVGLPKRKKFTLEKSKIENDVYGTLSFTVSSMVVTSKQDVRIFGRIWYGDVLESKIVYIDSSEFSRFYICDKKFLDEVLTNMRDDYMQIQKLKMKEMKQKMKEFNGIIRDTFKKTG